MRRKNNANDSVLQVWRYTSDDGWFTVFDRRVVPDYRNTVQTVSIIHAYKYLQRSEEISKEKAASEFS